MTTRDNEILTPAYQSFFKGSYATLSWNFTISPNLQLITVSINFNGQKAATIVASNNLAGVGDKFKGQFNISWISQKATLSILNVTDAEDKGEFTCELNTFEGVSNKIWSHTIQVNVIGKPYYFIFL